jgi:hypothetical protein
MRHRVTSHPAPPERGAMPHAHIAGKAIEMLPMQTAPIPGAEDWPVLPDAAKQVIVRRMMRHEPPERIAALIEQNFMIKVDRAQMLACWYARNAPAQPEPADPAPTIVAAPDAPLTQTERRQDKESVQLPADEVGEPLFTLMPSAETADAAPPTRTGPGQKEESRTEPGQEEEETVIMPDEVREYIIDRVARRHSPSLIADDVERKFGLTPDRDEILTCFRDRDTFPTRTGHGQKRDSKLNDEIKEFIVKRIACYETPSRIAAAVRSAFGIDIDRRRVFDYNPAGSRPPARRWIDLHAATRARFLGQVSEIGIAQKVIRLRMLDRYAEMAEDNHQHHRAARYVEQAARECGGFYERHPRAARGESAGASI